MFRKVQIPQPLIQSLQGVEGFDEAAFLNVHTSATPITSIRVHPQKSEAIHDIFPGSIERVPWSSHGYYLSERPSFTFDPLFHAGCYYVQEASSMFIEHVLQQTLDLSKPLKILDLCAAPGGKSTLIQSLLSKSSLLVSNEVIRQRVNVLKDNIVKWGCNNVIVTHNDPRDFAKLKGFFDVIVVDAPCSGSGLFKKDEDAIKEWSENNVILCSQRQQRILADVMPALKENGIIIYSTCSYSKEEDEDILDWLSTAFSLSNIRLDTKPEWHIVETTSQLRNYGYRFWPHLLRGEGFFVAAFRKNDGEKFKNKTRFVSRPVTRQLAMQLDSWMDISEQELQNVKGSIYAWPKVMYEDYDLLLQHLRVVYSGTLAGALVHNKFIPDHALAMSPLIHTEVSGTEVDASTAIAYLQRKNIEIPGLDAGWNVIRYRGHNLGWVNVLPTRINNYYPKELRILKEKP